METFGPNFGGGGIVDASDNPVVKRVYDITGPPRADAAVAADPIIYVALLIGVVIVILLAIIAVTLMRRPAP
jgi:hypothetical protein